jgi:lysophospholipase L1-like esterase
MVNQTGEFGPQVGRRTFLAAGSGLTAASLATLASLDVAAAEEGKLAIQPPPTSIIQPGATILFQGDSITDVGRNREDKAANSQPALGSGYAWLSAAQLLVDRPDADLKIYNRGVSGDKVFQLADRWQADCLELKPDVLSILIGVNDFWHTRKHGYEGSVEKYEGDYRALIGKTKAALPNVKLVICEPFVLKVGEVDDAWAEQFGTYRAAAKRVAEESGAAFVPFQTMFDLATKIAPPERWAADGVHPSSDGAALMAHWWLRAAGD